MPSCNLNLNPYFDRGRSAVAAVAGIERVYHAPERPDCGLVIGGKDAP
jgi:hypothetical protein